MGLFDFLNNKEKIEQKEITAPTLIIGMILLDNEEALKIEEIIKELEEKWGYKSIDLSKEERVTMFGIDNYPVAITKIDKPIPIKDIKSISSYQYNWERCFEDTKDHESHLIVSMLNTGNDVVKENMIFSSILSAILSNSNSIAAYIGSRSLLIEKKMYIDHSELMLEDEIPLLNWIYFGLRVRENLNSIYTYGLTDFGKTEIEIVDSLKTLKELHEFTYNISYYILQANINFKDGETVGLSETQKLSISYSKSVNIDDYSLKIDY